MNNIIDLVNHFIANWYGYTVWLVIIASLIFSIKHIFLSIRINNSNYVTSTFVKIKILFAWLVFFLASSALSFLLLFIFSGGGWGPSPEFYEKLISFSPLVVFVIFLFIYIYTKLTK